MAASRREPLFWVTCSREVGFFPPNFALHSQKAQNSRNPIAHGSSQGDAFGRALHEMA